MLDPRLYHHDIHRYMIHDIHDNHSLFVCNIYLEIQQRDDFVKNLILGTLGPSKLIGQQPQT